MFRSRDDLASALGAWGESSPVSVSQEMVDTFAQVTGDVQWIHCDQERAAASPLGGTVAHGFLTLSLVPRMYAGLWTVEGPRWALNYGLNRVRFLAPVMVGSQLRLTTTIASVEERESGQLVTYSHSMHAEVGGDRRLVMVAEHMTLYAWGTALFIGDTNSDGGSGPARDRKI